MLISEFKFSNPRLIKLNFQLNSNHLPLKKHETKMNISVSHSANKINENEAAVELNIQIGEASNCAPFLIDLSIGAKFKLDAAVEETDFDKLLEVNAPALLFSYARPIISSITSQAGMKPLNLPFVNFTCTSTKDT